MEVRSFMYHNMQGEHRAVIALERFATEFCILTCLEMTKLYSLACQKCRKSHIICYAKMLKITLLLQKDFVQNFMLAEGL